jgi:hypothetical protein
MGHKIFVSYKYADSNVKPLSYYGQTQVHDYVRLIENNILKRDVYKGEKQDEDLSFKSDAYIWEHLKDKIYDSSVTIVLISPNMKIPYKHDKSQWIPWEISYSLRLTTRDDRTSQRNALLAVVLPDRYGSYNYYHSLKLFQILRYHIDVNYARLVDWDTFSKYPQTCINEAITFKKQNEKFVAPTLN